MKLLATGGSRIHRVELYPLLLKTHPDSIILNLDKLTYAGNLGNLSGVEESGKMLSEDISPGNLTCRPSIGLPDSGPGHNLVSLLKQKNLRGASRDEHQYTHHHDSASVRT
jgi:hypothetical protein